MELIMRACVCIYIMVVEERRDGVIGGEMQCVDQEFVTYIGMGSFIWFGDLQNHVTYTPQNSFADFMHNREMILMESVGHIALKSDLVQHIWKFRLA